jgi:hypothetical protein
MGVFAEFQPEPPPDVATAVADRLSAAVEYQGLGAGYSSAFATSVAPLLRRSQGLQYHRGAAFYLCVANMNGLLTPAQFLVRWDSLQKGVVEVMKAEVQQAGFVTAALPDGTTVTIPPLRQQT